MPIIEYDTYKQKLGALEPQLEKLAAALDLEGARREVEELEEKAGDANFWNDMESSQKVLRRTKQLKNKLESHIKCFPHPNSKANSDIPAIHHLVVPWRTTKPNTNKNTEIAPIYIGPAVKA